MKKPTTMTEIMMLEEAKHRAYMNWRIAKALVEGKVDSQTLRWAEMQYETQKDIFEPTPKRKVKGK